MKNTSERERQNFSDKNQPFFLKVFPKTFMRLFVTSTLLIINFVKSQTSLITNFPEELYISVEDKLSLKMSEIVNSTMAVTQTHPRPLVSQESPEERIHEFRFNPQLSGGYSCLKAIQKSSLEFAFVCRSQAHVEKQYL